MSVLPGAPAVAEAVEERGAAPGSGAGSGAGMVRDGQAVRPGHYDLAGLLRSEWTKLRTVRSTMWTLVVTVVVGVGVSALATAETRAHWASMPPGARAGFDPVSTSLIALFFCQLAIGVLGVLVVSAEYGTGTIRATLAAAPRRSMVLAAKVAVFGAISLVVAEIVAFVSFFVGQALLTAPATHATLSTPGALRAVVGTGLYLCVIGLFALALGAILRHTAGGISAFVGILLVLPLIVQALPTSLRTGIARYLPAQLGVAMIQPTTGPSSFSPWVGFGVLCAYTVGLLVIGGVLLVRRDA